MTRVIYTCNHCGKQSPDIKSIYLLICKKCLKEMQTEGLGAKNAR